jgi:uncharacterized alpha-E superfamily protein
MAGGSLGQMDAETALKNLPSLLEWTKNRTAAFRGASEISLLRNDGYFFLRMGGLIERADMTLRLLDVKILRPACPRPTSSAVAATITSGPACCAPRRRCAPTTTSTKATTRRGASRTS